MKRITNAAIWPDNIPAARFAAGIERKNPDGCEVAMVGLADDQGVRMNGGRAGAAEGPYAFRAALATYGAAGSMTGPWPKVFDAGDVVPALTLTETHRRVTRIARAVVELDLLPIGIGGGHDLTFAFMRGVAEAVGEPLTGIYFDAHLDVREAEGSGMPFRRLLEGGSAKALHVFGLDPFVNTTEHLAWFESNGGRVGGFRVENEWPAGPLFVSVDLDVLDQAHAPGVSATNPAGWAPTRLLSWIRAAGRNPRVRAFDLMELAPRWDQDGRTARLAARLFLTFLRGVAERPAERPPERE